jgi:hypothetical protein
MTSKNISTAQTSPHSANSLLHEGIIAFAILQMFLSATIPSLKIFQIPVEILLLGTLVYGCMTIRLDRWQVLLLLVLVFVTTASFLTTDFAIFSVNAKQNSLAVFTLIYFSRVEFKSALIFPIFVISIVFLIINKIYPELLLPFISLTFNEEFNLSRFGGVFLNAHFNAFFLAIALIYYGKKRHLFGLGASVVYFTASKYVFVSYIANVVMTLPLVRYLAKYRKLFLFGTGLLISTAVYIFARYADALVEFLSLQASAESSHTSLIIILLQLIDPAYYTLLLNPFPSGTIDVTAAAKVPYGNHDGANEIGFFGLATQSGIFLAVTYLCMLIRHARFYAVFILFTLLHNNYIVAPLAIYMLVTYSREILVHHTTVTFRH